MNSSSSTTGVDISLLAEPCDGWRQKQGQQIKTWADTIAKDFERIGEPEIFGLR